MDDATKRDIDDVLWRLLQDAGETEPPVQTEVLLEHLNLFRHFYDLQDPGFLDRARHRLHLKMDRFRGIFRRIDLKAILFDEEKRIVIDQNLPELKRDHPSCHEITHRVIPWHKAYFFADTAQMLDPEWQETLEEEANYGASTIRFCGPVFTRESRDSAPSWASADALYKRYKKSRLATLRRYVEYGPDHVMALLVSTPPWLEKPDRQLTRCRYFIRSPAFERLFGAVETREVLGCVDRNVRKRRGGPVGSFTCALADGNGTLHEFISDAFFNQHYLMTLFVWKTELGKRAAIVVPA